MPREDLLEAGVIVTTHGIEGELKVQPWCDSAEFLLQFKKLYIGRDKTRFEVAGGRIHKGHALIRLSAVESIELAMPLVGGVVYFARRDVTLPEGTYFFCDLIGLQVVDADDGEVYGKLSDVFRTGANDVYEVTMADGRKELIPAIKDVVISTDIDAGRLEIRPLRGLFSDDA